MEENNKIHYVVVTGIVIRDGKYFIAKRSDKEAAFPGLWTVPGGKLVKDDYINEPKHTGDSWYKVLEKSLKREVKEEAGLDVENVRYLTNIIYIRSDGIPTLIISLYCDYAGGEVNLSDELVESTWVSGEELDNYKFVPGLKEEIELVDKELKEGIKGEWEGKYDSKDDESLRDGLKN